MKRIITLLAFISLYHLVVSAQKKYEMVIEKTDGSEIAVNVEDIVRTYFRERSSSSCPDSNHPHMVDLGLPSGTKWACCNVGATTPEDYGNYYAWGETQPKSVYNDNTYQYYNGSLSYPDSWINIGSDIAGTEYDAATANWGAPWRMPTKAQCEELFSNCTSEWTTQNGVNGRKFIGPNEATIFLPAAGNRWNSQLSDKGSNGVYWTSMDNESSRASASYFSFDSGEVSVFEYGMGRCYGASVRPVR